MRDILFRTDDLIFSYRVGGILVKNGKLLLQKPKDDDYAMIGGHVTAFETAEDALRREYGEEIHAEIKVERLVATSEIFFKWGNLPCHQICFYYTVSLLNDESIPQDGVFHGYDEFGGERIDLDFVWVPISELQALTVYPRELMPHIISGCDGVIHFVSKED